jgi:sugar phosphate isomerase/epimerase
MMTTSRRTFLQTLAGAAIFSRTLRAQRPLKHPATGTIGLQLYSLRHLFEKGDIAGTLAMVRGWGFTDVEAAGTYKLSPADFAAHVKKAGLRIASTGADFDLLAKDVGTVIKDAKTFGAQQVMCAWIPHDGPFARAHVDNAVKVFSKAGAALRDAGLRFVYHAHGYEFQEGPDGTLFDALAKQTEPGVVDFQMDVFWIVHGGANPVELFSKYPGRFRSTHLKDMRKGTKIGDATGNAPDDTSVVLGEGIVDIPGVLRAANKAGVTLHFIEDEHPQAEQQIPRSLDYLASLKL